MNVLSFLLVALIVAEQSTLGQVQLDADSAEANFYTLLDPCANNHFRPNHHSQQLPTSSHSHHHHFAHQPNIGGERRRSRIVPVPDRRFEIDIERVIDRVKTFSDFQSYLDHHLEQNGLSSTATLSDLWSPPVTSVATPSSTLTAELSSSFQPHMQTSRSLPPPYAYFDLHTHSTKLTWCDKLSTSHQDKDMDEALTSKEQTVLWEAMRNRRLMFVGDSLTRYQYITLTAFLTKEEWSTDERLVNEHYYPSGGWTEFYQNSTAFHQGMELCECYRSSKCCSPNDVSENRKYYNAKLNTTIWYIQWFGDSNLPHGHFSVEHDIQPLDCMPTNCKLSATDHSWIAKSATEFILQFAIAQQPDHVIMNTGAHVALNGKTEMSTREGNYWRSHYQSLSQLSTKFIFKSTTLHFGEKVLTDNRELDFLAYQFAASGLWEYWDIAAVIYELYIVYRKLELPYYYYREEEKDVES